jgi:hypothetical protein
MEITCITVDCADPHRVAQFWDDALEWGGVATSDDGAGAICGPPSGGIYLEFVKAPEGKVTKNRVHLGCTAGSLDQLDAEIERLRGLGATVAWEEDFPAQVATVFRNVVLRDVEGNEFCLGAGSWPG